MDLVGRKLAGITLGAAVGNEMHGIATLPQLEGQRLCRKDVATGAPGGKKDDAPAHNTLTPPACRAARGRGSGPAHVFPDDGVSAPE